MSDHAGKVSDHIGLEFAASQSVGLPIFWLDGPRVQFYLPGREAGVYACRSLQDASAIVFLRIAQADRSAGQNTVDGRRVMRIELGRGEKIVDSRDWITVEHPLSRIANAIERTEWHVPSSAAFEAIGSEPTLNKVCEPKSEIHFVNAPTGDTFSACRFGIVSREVGGAKRVAVVGLAMGDILLVEGFDGYGAIARRAERVAKAPVLWGA